jgi:hypothetical protein
MDVTFTASKGGKWRLRERLEAASGLPAALWVLPGAAAKACSIDEVEAASSP